jgi:hypothetical protein
MSHEGRIAGKYACAQWCGDAPSGAMVVAWCCYRLRRSNIQTTMGSRIQRGDGVKAIVLHGA